MSASHFCSTIRLHSGRFLLTLLSLLLVQMLTAQTWTGNTDSDWNKPGNWNPMTVPTVASNATIPDVTTDPVITSGTAAVAKSVTVNSGGSLTIAANSSLTINGSTSHGVVNNGTITNSGNLSIGTTTSIGASGLLNSGSCTNSVGGSININLTTNDGIQNQATFTNQGIISMGSSGAIGAYGIYNLPAATFTNRGVCFIGGFSAIAGSGILNDGTFLAEGGGINIDRTSLDGISNSGTFTNKSNIDIGAGGTINGNGILNYDSGTFLAENGIIIINRTSVDGISNFGTFKNKATINIGLAPAIGRMGILNAGSAANFSNEIGNINIGQAAYGIYAQAQSAFTNQATLTVGFGGLYNITGSSFNNTSCAIITLNGKLSNEATVFSNAGLLILNTNQTHINTGTLTNNGIITYPQGNTVIPNVINNDFIVAPVSGPCTISNALQKGGMVSFTAGSTWYLDQALTTPAATYDQAANTLTLNSNLSEGAYVLYFTIAEAGCTRTVSVRVTYNDVTAPLPVCKNATVNLSAAGTGSITTADVFQSGTDNCGTVNQMFVTPNTFNCSHIGTNTVTLTVNDGHGNIGTCMATVTVNDNIVPAVVCQNTTVNLSAAGTGSITTAAVFQSGTDNCGTVNQFSVSPSTFTCSNLGANVVTLTVNDGHGNTATCTATVTVNDNIAPTVICKNATVNLSAAGTGSITTAAVFQSGSDNCGTVNLLFVSQSTFNCSNLGTNSVELYANDGHGNTSRCFATVTVNDNIAPTVVCQNATVNLSSAGTGNVTTAAVFQSGADNCGTVNQISVSPGTFACSDIGTNVVTLIANDGHGNTATCTATVTVVDNTSPTASCKDVTVQLSATGTATILGSTINNNSSDACGIMSISATVAQSPFTCANLGTNIVTLTVNDRHGNTSTCTATVTIVDNIAPSVVCKNATVNLNTMGTANVTTALVFQSGTDNCGTVNPASVLPNTFNCANIGANIVTLTANDGHGNTSTCTSTVTVNDNIAPTVVCQNATVSLDAAGTGGITTTAVFQSGTDNCGTVNQVSVSPNAFTCSNVGANMVTLTANDGHSNTGTCTATVTVVDNTSPVANCKIVLIQLDATGTASTTAAALNDNSSDACGIASLNATQTTFTCANQGPNAVILTATDNHGNTSTCIATVIVRDYLAPSVVCKNTTVNLNASGAASISTDAVFQSGTDNCGTVNPVSVSPNAFTCANIGTNIVILTANDGYTNTNTGTCTATVTVVDNTPPIAICQNMTVQLNAAGTGSTTAAAVNSGSSDACGIASLVLSQTAFSCTNLGANTVTLTVTDNNSNSSTCTATVTVVDNIAPMVVCKNATVNLNALGATSITTAAVFQSGTDNCGTINQVSVLPNTFNCANVGANTVTLTANDGHGNTSTCTATITVVDNTNPIALCQNVTVQLNVAGTASTTAAAINNNSSDACGLASLVLSQTAFTCTNLGANTVTLTATDNNGNSNTCTATVTLVDNIAPSVVCKNATVNLNTVGTASITTAAVFQSGTDNCGIVNQVSVLPNAFTCANVGANTVTLTANDGHGNTSTCTATVTVVDNTSPIAVCQNVTVQLNTTGAASTTAAAINNNSSDACGLASLVLSQTAFTCTNLGANTVTLTATDNNGNSNTCTATVTVVDNIAPSVVCKNTTVNLNAVGSGSITPSAVFQSGADNCGIVNQVSVLPNAFTCANVGANTVTLTANDGHGNTSTCTATVTVVDNTAPIAVCQNVTVQLNTAGTGNTTAAAINNSSSDACGIAALVLSQTAFTCTNLGANTVTLTATDNNGNSNTCTATVTVVDNIAPSVVCKNTTVNLNAVGSGSITPSAVFQSGADNCGIVNQVSVLPNAFTCANVGANTVTLTANDGHGNTSTCTATVTVVDNTSPIAVCQNVTVQLNATGAASTTAAAINNNSSDACGLASLVLSQTAFTCTNLGANTVTLTATDNNGNSSTCTATVTVVDNITPSVVCKNATVNLNTVGAASITTNAVFQSGADNCGTINQVSVLPNTFSCSNLGANLVTLNVNDGHGNTATCTATVTVVDNLAPTATCQNATVSLSAAGTGSITTAAVFQSGADNCGIVNQVSVLPNTFTCSNLGTNVVTLNVNDGHGNTATCSATVTVVDNLAPTVVCKNTILNLNSSGFATLNPADVFQSGADNCGIVNLVSASPSAFTCSTIGNYATTLLVNDGHGNTATCTATVTVNDNIAPTVICQNTTVNLSAAGTVSITTAAVFQSGADNCGTVNQVSVLPNTFTCSNLGANVVTLNVNDSHGNTASCTATVTVIDNMAPTVVCKNATVNLSDVGAGSITTATVFQSSADNCGIVNQVSVAPNTFTCSNLGTNTVTLTVNDGHGNTATCIATVTVADNLPPKPGCQNATVLLNAQGTGSVTPQQVFQGGNDNCGIINPVSVTPNTFTCSNLGANSVTLVVNDGHGNTNFCGATVTVVDQIAPTVVCKNTTLNLSSSGFATLNPADVFQSGADNCGIVNLVSVAPNAFSCNSIGNYATTLFVNDGHGNTASCNAVVTVRDVTPPTALCKPVTVYLNAAGTATVVPQQVDNGSSDVCSIANLVVTPNTFTCANIGNNVVTLKVTDAGNNTTSCNATVTVKDNLGPNALCKNITVNLNDEGKANITLASVNNGTNDPCGIANLSINVSSFACIDIGSPKTVVLTARDNNGNTSSCLAYVTVKDVTPPTAVCENVTVALNAQGKATVNALSVAGSSFDNCSVWSYTPSTKLYTTANLGINSWSITVKDFSGNGSTCVAQVTVVPYGSNTNLTQSGNQNRNVAPTTSTAEALSLTVFPNPTEQDVTVVFQLPKEQAVDLRMFDLNGRLVLHQGVNGVPGENVWPLELGDQPSGVYLLQIQSDTQKAQQRLVIQRN